MHAAGSSSFAVEAELAPEVIDDVMSLGPWVDNRVDKLLNVRVPDSFAVADTAPLKRRQPPSQQTHKGVELLWSSTASPPWDAVRFPCSSLLGYVFACVHRGNLPDWWQLAWIQAEVGRDKVAEEWLALLMQGQLDATGRSRTSRILSHGTAVVCLTPRFASMMWEQRRLQWTSIPTASTWLGESQYLQCDFCIMHH
jgi:hypothetical protein